MAPEYDGNIRWQNYPMVRIIIPFLLGILISVEVNLFILLFSTWLVVMVYLLPAAKIFPSLPVMIFFRSTMLIIAIILMGSLVFKTHHQGAFGRIYPELSADKPGLFYGRISSEPTLKNAYCIFDFDLISGCSGIENPKEWKKISGKVRVILRTADTVKFEYGDLLFISGKPKIPPESKLPGTFSFREFLYSKGIKYILEPREADYLTLQENNSFLMKNAVRLRKYLIHRLEKNGLSGKELAVTSALIFGDKTTIDSQIISDYKVSGLVHILAVSGLHVGLVYGAALFILNILLRERFHLLKLAGVSIFIWVYAFITGFSPSVLRATIMFSFLALANSHRITISSYNTLATAAFLLILLDPFIWRDIGFQLSFAAVWGILAFSPLTNKIQQISNPLIRYLILSAAISFSAQAATSVFSLYHFGSFPLYFLFSNLVAVPLSTILTYWGIAASFLADCPHIGSFLSIYLGKGIALMNAFAGWVGSFPFAQINGYFIDEIMMLFLIVISLQFSFVIQQFTSVRFSILLLWITLASGYSMVQKFATSNELNYLVFSHKGQDNCLFTFRGKAYHFIWGKSTEKDSLVYDAIKITLAKNFGVSACSKFLRNEIFNGQKLSAEKSFLNIVNQKIQWKKLSQSNQKITMLPENLPD